jgi:hypothetical protein
MAKRATRRRRRKPKRSVRHTRQSGGKPRIRRWISEQVAETFIVDKLRIPGTGCEIHTVAQRSGPLTSFTLRLNLEAFNDHMADKITALQEEERIEEERLAEVQSQLNEDMQNYDPFNDPCSASRNC